MKIRCDGQVIEQLSKFAYICELFIENGKCEEEFSKNRKEKCIFQKNANAIDKSLALYNIQTCIYQVVCLINTAILRRNMDH